jgi:hypothetical protein
MDPLSVRRVKCVLVFLSGRSLHPSLPRCAVARGVCCGSGPIGVLLMIVCGASLCLSPIADAAEEAFPPQGEIRLQVVDGGSARELRYRFRDRRLRIDRPGKLVPSPPVNIVDQAAGKLRILHPHNATWEEAPIDSTNRSVRPLAPTPALLPPAGPPPALPSLTPPTTWPEPLKLSDDLPAGIGPGPPGLSPDFSPLAAGMAPGVPAGMPSIPGMPAFPPMPMLGEAEPMALMAQDPTNALHGFSCRLHEVEVPDWGTMSLWVSDDPRLPPFYLLMHEVSCSSGRSEWYELVTALLREAKAFPFHAVLKSESGHALATWEVLAVTFGLAGEDADLFGVPAEFHRLPPRAF